MYGGTECGINNRKKKNLRMGRSTVETKATEKKCNCRYVANCPLTDNCLMEGLVYRAKVKSIKGKEKLYMSSTGGTFKTWRYNHESSFKLGDIKTEQGFLYVYGK